MPGEVASWEPIWCPRPSPMDESRKEFGFLTSLTAYIP